MKTSNFHNCGNFYHCIPDISPHRHGICGKIEMSAFTVSRLTAACTICNEKYCLMGVIINEM